MQTIKKEDKAGERQDDSSNPFMHNQEVVFENFFGADVKELFKSVMTYPIEKVIQCLFGPKIAIYGFEQVLPGIGMKLIRSDPWEVNPRSGAGTRKFLYSLKHADNVFQNTEIVESVQSFSSKK